MTTAQLWEQFFYHLRIKRRASTTLLYYGVTQRALERYAAQEPAFPEDPALLTVTHLRAFITSLEVKGLAAGGVHAHVRAVKALLGWVHAEELLPRNLAKRLERPALPSHRLPTVTATQIGVLLKIARKSVQPLRDTALLLMFQTSPTGVGNLSLLTARRQFTQTGMAIFAVRPESLWFALWTALWLAPSMLLIVAEPHDESTTSSRPPRGRLSGSSSIRRGGLRQLWSGNWPACWRGRGGRSAGPSGWR